MEIGTAYYNGIVMQSVTIFMIVMIVAVVLVIALDMRRTQKYRKHIADLYVAAKIRFFAKKDDLDLVAEEKAFKSWAKKRSLEGVDLDGHIAVELADRIEKSDEPIKKKEK